MNNSQIRTMISFTALLTPALYGTTSAEDMTFIDQLRLDARDSVAENCSIEKQAIFDWENYANKEEEELILVSLIEAIQNNSSSFCIPPDVSSMKAKISLQAPPPPPQK